MGDNIQMISEKIALCEYKDGDILADDVVNAYGVVLAASGILLNDYIIEKLGTNGIKIVIVYRTVKITDDEVASIVIEKKYFNTFVQTKRLFHRLLRGKSFKHEEVLLITHDINNHLHINDDKLIKWLIKLKTADEYTYYHSVNVAFYSMLLSNWLKLSESKIEKVIQAGLLHDLGKIRIPGDILNKKGILTREEFDIIKEHTLLGFEMVKKIADIDLEVKKAVLLHHERLDGSGYPYQYKHENEELNIYSKIVAIADVFDAMTSERVYKKKATPFEAFEMFQTVGLSMFDTKMTKVFIEKMAVYLVNSEVLLSSGEQGKIVYIPLHSVTCPVIQTSSGYIDLSQTKEVRILSMI